MSANSSIAWTDATWNPVRGCSRVSEGCRNCYAERMAARFSGIWKAAGQMRPGDPQPFHTFAEKTASGPRWTGKVELIPEMLEIPLHWEKPRRVFVNSMSDLFHEKLWARDIDKVFAIMSQSPQHTFQVLTKRPKQMLEYMRAERTPDGIDEAGVQFGWCHANVQGRWPLPNVWLGVSCEDQKTADERIPMLLQTPAAVRFVSAEPLLGRISFTSIPVDDCIHANALIRWCDHPFGSMLTPDARIDWVIVGGESGPGARPMHPQWARDIRDQCVMSGVAFFFKQWGEYRPADYGTGTDPEPVKMLRVGKKAAGRLLDGREWNEFPICQENQADPQKK